MQRPLIAILATLLGVATTLAIARRDSSGVNRTATPPVKPAVVPREQRFAKDQSWQSEFLHSVEAGNPDALIELAMQLAADTDQPESIRMAREALLRAANLGSGKAKHLLGTFAERGLVDPADGQAAAKWYEAASNHGNVESFVALGRLHLEGKLLPVDIAAATGWLTAAISEGNTEAMYLLAAGVLTNSEGTIDEGIALLTKASQLGFGEASRLLARLYSSNQLVPENPLLAIDFAMEAMASGARDSKADLAGLLLRYGGQEAQTSTIVNLLEQDSEMNSGKANFELARILLRSPEHTAGILTAAREYASRATEQKHPGAIAFFAQAEAGLDRSDEAKILMRTGYGERDWRSMYAFNLHHVDHLPLAVALAKANRSTLDDYVADSNTRTSASPQVSQKTLSERSFQSPSPLYTPTPTLPPGLVAIGASPRYDVSYTIRPDGTTSDISLPAATHPGIVDAIVKTISQWRNEPAISSKTGRPTAVRVHKTIFVKIE